MITAGLLDSRMKIEIEVTALKTRKAMNQIGGVDNRLS